MCLKLELKTNFDSFSEYLSNINRIIFLVFEKSLKKKPNQIGKKKSLTNNTRNVVFIILRHQFLLLKLIEQKNRKNFSTF